MKTKKRYLLTTLATSLLLCACSDNDETPTSEQVDKEAMSAQETQTSPDQEMPKTLIAEPVEQEAATESMEKNEVTLTGSIIYKDLEGGFFAFIAENGDRYTLHGLDESHQRNGLIVEVNGVTKPDVMTFTQFGTVLQVKEVKVLDSSKVIESKPTH